jgi:hypothetical protein
MQELEACDGLANMAIDAIINAATINATGME